MKGTIVWFLGFMSFLAALNVINSVMMLTLNGGDFVAGFSFNGLALGNLSVIVYLMISLIATFMLLGSTVYFVFKGLPADPDVLHRLATLESQLSMNQALLENTQIGFFTRLEKTEKATDDAFRRVQLNLEEARKEMNGALEKQNLVMQNVQSDSNRNSLLVKRQANDMTTIRKRVGAIEKALTPTQKAAKLKSNSKMDTVSGVNPNLEKELKNLGIMTVGQFLTTDPVTIAEKTMQPFEAVTSLQAKAQLLMVPSLTSADADLLVKAGVASRKELANQDPIQLSRTLVGMANVYVEQGKLMPRNVPTIDEVWTWIKSAQP